MRIHIILRDHEHDQKYALMLVFIQHAVVLRVIDESGMLGLNIHIMNEDPLYHKPSEDFIKLCNDIKTALADSHNAEIYSDDSSIMGFFPHDITYDSLYGIVHEPK